MSLEAKSVFTLADLQNWAEVTSGSLRRPRLAVIGDPVAHSRSPQMHNPALIAAGIDCEYVRLHLRAEELEAGIEAMKAAHLIGFNVTIPHKAAMCEIVDELSETAQRVRAVNTVAIRDGRLFGHNTDAPGLHRAIHEAFGVDLHDLRVLVVGAGGGAGRAAAVECAMSSCRRLVLANRTVEKATLLADELLPLLSDQDDGQTRIRAIRWDADSLSQELGEIDLIINATSIGMKADDPDVLPPGSLKADHLVYDMVYAPPQTRLMSAAKECGARAANGLGMLLWQGALAFEYWFSREAPVEAMREGLERE